MPPTAAPGLRVAHPPPGRPVLLFDGECGFCRLWVERWRAAAGDQLDLETSQSAGPRFPEIPPAEFARAVQLVEPGGEVFSGAEAVLRARAVAARRSWLLAAYERIPGFAPAAGIVYRFVAGHRPLFSGLTRLFWGPEVRRPTFGISTCLFLRLLGAVHLIAFVSFWIQYRGLVGPDGILPAQSYFDAVRDSAGAARFWELPTLCWWFGAGRFLAVLCAAGVVLSLAVMAGVAPAAGLALLWAAYLSLCAAGQEFWGFQWDGLLLEATLLAVLLAPWSAWTWRARPDPPRPARWLLWWLLIRLMLLSGAAKWLSGDDSWHNLSALNYHFETQPLPTWIGWYAHQLPAGAKAAACALMFAVELGGPFLLLLPRRARHAGAGLQIGFQALIALTGNYTFFNLLTAALCVLFLDDPFWRGCARRLGRSWPRVPAGAPEPRARACPQLLLVPAAMVGFTLTGLVTALTLRPALGRFAWLAAPVDAVAPLRSVNSYGLFAVMTRERPEIIIEGSDDGHTWLPYGFAAKPGDLKRRPGFVAPYQPRLDWQLWFAALDYPQRSPWVTALCVRLLQGAPDVTALFAANPFPAGPPRQVRAVLYDYTFTDRVTRAATGRWWDRSPVDFYVPPMALR